SARFTGERDRVSYELELQRTRGSLMFSPETFVSADVGSNLVLSWDVVEQTVDIPTVEVDSLPSELRPLVEMLKELDLMPPAPPEPTPDPNATPVPEGEEAEPTPTPEPVLPLPEPPSVVAERSRLSERQI